LDLYREALAGAGKDPDQTVVVAGNYTEESGFQATRTILEDPRNADLTALIYANDLMALGGMRLLKKLGKEIPHDISIVGFDDITSSQYVFPALTTVAQPSYEMGRSAAQPPSLPMRSRNGRGSSTQTVEAGADDLGGTLMNESITRAAGAIHGQEFSPQQMTDLIRGAGRIPVQRTTLYGEVPEERIRTSFQASRLTPMVNTPLRKRAASWSIDVQ
jgi:hypothetical protein